MEEEKLCDNLGQGEEGKIEGEGEKFINKTILLLATSLSPLTGRNVHHPSSSSSVSILSSSSYGR